MTEWNATPGTPTQLPAEPVAPPEPTQLPAEPQEGQSGSEGPKRRRRGAVSLDELLVVVAERRQAQVDKLKAREAALAAELDKVQAQRACAEAELVRLYAVRGDD